MASTAFFWRTNGEIDTDEANLRYIPPTSFRTISLKRKKIFRKGELGKSIRSDTIALDEVEEAEFTKKLEEAEEALKAVRLDPLSALGWLAVESVGLEEYESAQYTSAKHDRLGCK